MFVGYSTLRKRFRCLDHHIQRVYISRHVAFDETIFPFSISFSSSISSSLSYHVFFSNFPVSSPSLSCCSSGSSLAGSISTTLGPTSSSLPTHPCPSYATDFVSSIPPSSVIAFTSPLASPTSLPTQNKLVSTLIRLLALSLNPQLFALFYRLLPPLVGLSSNLMSRMHFLHGILNKEVFMHQLPGYVDPCYPNHVCRLNKTLHSLKQAPWAWFHRFSTFLLQFGFRCNHANPSFFAYQQKVGTLYLLVYVDDIVLTSSNPRLLKDFIARLSNEIAMKDLGDLHYFLGIEVHHTPQGLFLSKCKYALDILERASMVDYKLVSTPMVMGQHLFGNGSPYANVTHFCSIVGAPQYLAITLPDLAHSVNTVCQFMHAPTVEHYLAVKRILCYRFSSFWSHHLL